MSGDLSASAFRKRTVMAHAALVCVALPCAALIAFPPQRFAIYPLCPVHEYLGILCPGCGATHALAALLRGHVLVALHENALFTVLLPFAVVAALSTYRRAIRAGEFRSPSVHTPVLAAMLLMTAAFTLARNIAR